MIVKETVIQKPNHLGGKGTIEIHAAMQGEEIFRGHGRMLAMVTLPPGSSIGYHQHVGETETYFIVEGHGTFTHNGVESPIGPGEVGLMEVGDFHGIENTGDTDLKMVALIWKE